MTESDRVLHTLLHELRTPLSAACGYLRLVREQLLGTPEERDLALASMQHALGGISRLCEDAGAFLIDTPADTPTQVIAAQVLVNWVVAVLRARGLATMADAVDRRHVVPIGGNPGRVAEAIVTLLGAVTHQAEDPRRVAVTVATDGSRLRFTATPDAAPAAFDAPFDPWRNGNGLAVPLAYRVIDSAGGRIASAPPPLLAVSLSFPLQIEAE